MRLVSLFAHGFRNLVEVKLAAHPRLNVMVGPNGVGKTNLLEAVHLVAALRPLRPVERARDLVGFGLEKGRVQGDFDLDGPLPIEVLLEAKGRRATLAGKQVKDIAQVAARIGVVSFTPEDLAIVRAGPDRRRRALDRYAYSRSPGLAEVARRYESALSQRNRLLKEPPVHPDLLEAYTAPLVEAGAALWRARMSATQVWAPAFEEAVREITDGGVVPGLRYRSAALDEEQTDPGEDLPEEAALAARFRERLEEKAGLELDRRTTMVGPHLDDLVITKDERRARHLASQGEARALVLALKIAEVRTVAAARETPPLLLLDDVAGELDPGRAACLFATVDEVSAQTFVTCTHVGALPPPGPCSVFELDEGRLSAREEAA